MNDIEIRLAGEGDTDQFLRLKEIVFRAIR